MRDVFRRAALIAALTLVPVATLSAQQRAKDKDRARTVRACDPEWDDDCPQSARSSIDTTFAFDRRGVVEVSAHSGDIQITGWSRNEVRIVATTEHGELIFSPGAARITLGARMRHGRLGETRFQLSVPQGTRVVAKTQSGDITVGAVKGEVDISTMSGEVDVADAAERIDISSASGDVTLRGANGTTRIHALSGEVDARNITGDVEIESVSGEVLMSAIDSRFVRGESTSGDVEFSGTIHPDGRYELRSHSGDLRVDIPATASAWVDVETFSGEIESDFPITLQPTDRNSGSRPQRFDFKIGEGRARVSLESFSGEIRIISRSAAAP